LEKSLEADLIRLEESVEADSIRLEENSVRTEESREVGIDEVISQIVDVESSEDLSPPAPTQKKDDEESREVVTDEAPPQKVGTEISEYLSSSVFAQGSELDQIMPIGEDPEPPVEVRPDPGSQSKQIEVDQVQHSKADSDHPVEFWSDCEKAENSIGKAWEASASPKNKKRNQTRRARREATRRRLKDEAVKEEARQTRLREREERRRRRSACPKKPRKVTPEGPVLIQVKERSNR
jgi:hypothetical protein